MAAPTDESRAERLDRELIELLNEIRVLLPGVQVLFAFLLTAPFAAGFEKVSEFQRDLYAICLLSALAATVCLVAPTTYHRIQWRQGDKEALLRTSNRLTLAGSVFLAGSMTCSILLVGDYLFSRWVALVATMVTAFVFASLWYGLPLSRRVGDHRG
jgi:predicted membrane channel-forming protein YqfA (hemolysin III family)